MGESRTLTKPNERQQCPHSGSWIEGVLTSKEVPMTKVKRDQYEWDGNKLTHKPTGARFSRNSSIVNYGNAGDILENGECYERES